MDRTKEVNDFKKFLNEHRDEVRKNTIKLKDLPKDDQWIQDDAWDQIYRQTVRKNGKV